MLFPTTVFSTVYYVDPGDTIQDSIDAAIDGDTIIISPGMYYENLTLLGYDIVLTSTDPDSMTIVESTIIDGSQYINSDKGSVIELNGSESAECVIQGLTLQNGIGTKALTNVYGGGIFGNESNATIRKNIIRDNTAGWGGGISRCNGLIEKNIIYGNTGTYGCGLNECAGIIQNNMIRKDILL